MPREATLISVQNPEHAYSMHVHLSPNDLGKNGISITAESQISGVSFHTIEGPRQEEFQAELQREQIDKMSITILDYADRVTTMQNEVLGYKVFYGDQANRITFLENNSTQQAKRITFLENYSTQQQKTNAMQQETMALQQRNIITMENSISMQQEINSNQAYRIFTLENTIAMLQERNTIQANRIITLENTVVEQANQISQLVNQNNQLVNQNNQQANEITDLKADIARMFEHMGLRR